MSRKPFRKITIEDVPSELALLLVSPVLAPYNMYLAYHDWFHRTPKPEQRFDRQRTLFHAAIWGVSATASWGYHALVHPGKYPGLRAGVDIFKIVGHEVMHRIPVSAPIAAGYIGVPIGLALANRAVIGNAPAEQQASLWRSFAQGLTGTGPGVGGWTP